MDIRQTRESVLAEQKRAQEKMKRLEKRKGAVVAGSKHDPTRSTAWVMNARSRDLARYKARLEKFNSRSTQFIGDADGRPIDAKKWKALETEVSKLNKSRSEFYNSVKDLKMNSGVTLDQAAQLRTGKYVTYIDDFRNDKKVSPKAFYGEKAIDDATKRYRKLNNREAAGMMRDSRNHFLSIMLAEGASAPDWANRVADLTDKQFFVLWSATDFKRFVGDNYQMLQEGLTHASGQVADSNNKSIEELLDWVESPKVAQQLDKRIENLHPKRSSAARKGARKRPRRD